MGTAVCLQGRQPDVAPEDLDASSVVNLQGDASLRAPIFASVMSTISSPLSHVCTRSPWTFSRSVFQSPSSLRIDSFSSGNLHQPSAAVGLVDARRVVVLRSHFALPAVDLHRRLDERAEKDAGVAVGELLELHRQVEIIVVFARGEVTVFFVGTALADQQAVLVDIPFLGSVGFPSCEVAAVEEFDLRGRPCGAAP